MKRALVVTIAAALVIATPAIASARAGSAATSASSVASVRATGVQVVPATASRYLAGYRDSAAGGVTEMVIKAITAPPMSCTDRFEGIAVGAGSEPTLGTPEYFAGVLATCVEGKAVYVMDATVGGVEVQSPEVAVGDQVQIVIFLNCDGGPCEVFANATNLEMQDSKAEVTGTVTPTTDSGSYGAFPIFAKGEARPARVPNFGSTDVLGCQFNGGSLPHPERLIRRHGSTVQIKPSRFVDLSFSLAFKHH